MIYAVINNKGGAGKSTVAYHFLTAVLKNFNLIEIDDNNVTSAIFDKSESLKGKIRSVKVKDGVESLDDAIFDSSKDGSDIIIDAGGGNDSITVIKMLLESDIGTDNLTFIIPVMAGRAQVKNALDTYELVKGYKVVFLLNGRSSKDEFPFWFGSDEFEVDGVDKAIRKLPSTIVPYTVVHELAEIEGQTIGDIAKNLEAFEGSIAKAREHFLKISETKDEFKTYQRLIRIADRANKFINEDLAELKNILTGE